MTEKDEADELMNCGLTIDERDLLRESLTALPDTVPPRAVWQRIDAQAKAEGHFRAGISPATQWFAGAGIAAAVVLAVLNLPFATTQVDRGDGLIDATPPPQTATNNNVVTDLSALMVQSQQIERDLRSIPVRPSLTQVSTAATIADIEGRIASIDYLLNEPDVRMNPYEAETLWRERVRLMNLLLNLRRAQAQRFAF